MFFNVSGEARTDAEKPICAINCKFWGVLDIENRIGVGIGGIIPAALAIAGGETPRGSSGYGLYRHGGSGTTGDGSARNAPSIVQRLGAEGQFRAMPFDVRCPLSTRQVHAIGL
jgi:hypothetical protein